MTHYVGLGLLLFLDFVFVAAAPSFFQLFFLFSCVMCGNPWNSKLMLLSHSTPKAPTSDKNSQTTRPNDAMMDPVVIEMLTFDMQKKSRIALKWTLPIGML